MPVSSEPIASASRQPAAAKKGAAEALPSAHRSRRLLTAAEKEELRNRVYRFSNLKHYPLRDRLIIYAADLSFYSMVRAICSTLRWEVRGREHLDAVLASGHRPIFTFWHVSIISATWFWRNRGIVVMSSVSRDAEYTGRVIKRFGYGTARGSATRGGGRALAEMAHCLENGIEVGFSIDGPRGPAYVVKPGAVTLARHTGQAILPFHIATTSYIEVPSWDRLQIPLPFTRAAAFIGKPIYVPRDATTEEVTARQVELQAALDGLVLEAKRWSGKDRPTKHSESREQEAGS